jgi:cell cycle checkpoint control protein RAD9A
MDHFGPGIELLDINTDDDARVVNFTCFTEKVQKRGAVSNEGRNGPRVPPEPVLTAT